MMLNGQKRLPFSSFSVHYSSYQYTIQHSNQTYQHPVSMYVVNLKSLIPDGITSMIRLVHVAFALTSLWQSASPVCVLVCWPQVVHLTAGIILTRYTNLATGRVIKPGVPYATLGPRFGNPCP
jgi:hypothetical protein